MAMRMNPATKLQIKVVTSVDANGKEQLAIRSYSLNPALTDDEVRSIGGKLGALQAYPVRAVCRQDDAALAE